jgi:uncharacterized protein (DUF58 family)
MKPPLIWLVGLIFGSVLFGLATLNSSALILSIPLLAYLFAAIHDRPEEIRLAVNREIFPDQAPQGAPLTVKLTVTNVGRALDELVVEEVLPYGVEHIEGQLAVVTTLASQAQVVLEYSVTAQRGHYEAYELLTSARDSANLFDLKAVYRAGPRLVIHPRYPKLDRIKVRPPQTRGFAGPIAARQGGTGIDFYGIREYQAGDPQRQINWRISARHEQALFTTVYEQERVADVGLILDARQKMNVAAPHGSLFEYAVRATAALAESFLADGNRVSLLVYGGSVGRVFPGYGRVQKERILKALAKATPEQNYALETLAHLPTRFFPAKSQLVFISPLAAEDMGVLLKMHAQGYAVIVISPDPVSFITSDTADVSSTPYRFAWAEREFMLQQIRRSGVQVVNWRVDQPFEAVVRTALSRQAIRLHQAGLGM